MKTLLRLSTLLFLSFSLGLSAQASGRYITVSGSAQLTAPADYLSLKVFVETESNKPREAQAYVSTKITQVVSYLNTLAEVTEVSSNLARLQPAFTQSTPQKFRAYQEATFKLADLSAYNQVILAVLERGVNGLQTLGPAVGEPRAYEQQVLVRAIQKAREKAETMAAASGESLGQVIYVEEVGNPQVRSGVYRALGSNASGSAFEEAQVTFSQTVQVRFALTP
jgi:uncharacterized protein YggE